jgi:hypothetical protein
VVSRSFLVHEVIAHFAVQDREIVQRSGWPIWPGWPRRQIIISEFFSIKKESPPGNKVPIRQIPSNRSSRFVHRRFVRRMGEKGDVHKNRSRFIADRERYYRRFCQPTRWFLHSMRSKESTVACSVHAGRLVITE